MDDLVGSKAAAAITTTNKKRPRRTSRNQTHQPQDSMKEVVDSKMEAEAAVITTTNKKRPRRVRPTKSKPKEEEEEEALKEVDMEDLGFCGNEILEIRAFLLEWYDRNQRDLPWRRICRGDDEDGSDRRAYAVWVSEVMLQQTRVQTVIDYFNRWMHKWPTICHLARASIEDVNEMWAGLGYYRRARYLLEGSKKIVEGGGVFPKTVAALRKVPGIGDYTAGAIASIAFNEVGACVNFHVSHTRSFFFHFIIPNFIFQGVPVVDGNVIRVVARLKAISANPKESVTIKNFWKLAGQLVDPSRPGDFNQALMELGATVCTPLNPNCSVCPVSNHCHALSLARQNKSAQVTDYPTKVVKSKKRHEFSAVSVVEILDGQDMIEELQPDGRFLLVKRPDEGLLAGLWEFPSVLLGVETDLATRRYAIDQFLKKSINLDLKKSCTVVLREDIGQYIHVFSHIRLKMYVELLILHLRGRKNVLHGKPESETKAWKSVDSKALSSMGLTSGVRKDNTSS
ncbi:HhH-GPD base excision DNA repair family protein [Actinidia rufa]|uniref:Adenine DNA glycosylase n=1 Tax=Actinidia rufa TaxID=165716 RepID=A0A7J0FUE9_9ERIC|nr:HhH-GPD base excision DNA repair family protein [Actinidia rufa]